MIQQMQEEKGRALSHKYDDEVVR